MIEIDGNVYEFTAGDSINNVQVCILYDLVFVNIVFYVFLFVIKFIKSVHT